MKNTRAIAALAILAIIALACLWIVIAERRNPQTPRPLVMHCADRQPHPRGSWPLDMSRRSHADLNLRCGEIPPAPLRMMPNKR